MRNNLIVHLILFALFACLSIFAQAQKEYEKVFSQSKTKLIGLTQLDNNGFVILYKGKNKKMVDLTKLDYQGKWQWDASIEMRRSRGHTFNKLTLLHDLEFVYLISDRKKIKTIYKYENKSGELIHLKQTKGVQDITLGLNSAQLIRIKGDTVFHSTADYLKDFKKTPDYNTLFKLDKKVNDENIQLAAKRGDETVFASYTLESNHEKMYLQLVKFNFNTGDTLSRIHELTLANHTYTYNSLYDNKVIFYEQVADGFYALGKLDISFNGKDYPSQKNSESFVGFWIAKFDNNLEQVYFRELSFQEFEGLIPSNLINKPTTIALAETDKKGVFLNLSELRGVLYGNKYVVYLDSNAIPVYFTGGMDNYNFGEYTNKGIKDNVRKTNIRLINDDFNYYVTNFYLQIDNNKHFSESLNASLAFYKTLKRSMPENTLTRPFYSNGEYLNIVYQKRKRGYFVVYKEK